MSQRRSTRTRNPEPTPHVDLEYPSSVPTFTVNPAQLSSSPSSSTPTPTPWFSAFGRTDSNDPLPPACDPKYSDPAYYSSSSYGGKGARNTSHTAKKPEGHIKRPPNCFLLFRSHVKEKGIRIPEELKPILKDRLREKRREGRAKKGGDADNDDDEDEDDDDQDDDEQSVSKISGILWDFLPAAEKSIFRARAAHAKAQHKKFYPQYKYSPQVKDKSVKKRVGKKMAAEKRERLEEAASLLAHGMGWVQPTEGSSKTTVKRERSAPVSSTTAAYSNTTATSTPSMAPAEAYPGTSSFPISAYSHQPPHAQFPGPVPPHNFHHDGSSVPMSAVEQPTWSGPSTGLGMGIGTQMRNEAAAAGAPVPRMARRTSSCPPPGAHLTWTDLQSAPPPSTQAWTHPQTGHMQPPPPPPAQTFVRPGGKTVRKMRTGGSAKANLLGTNGSENRKKGHGARSTSSSSNTNNNVSSGGMTLPTLPNMMKRFDNGVPMTAISYDSSEGSANGGWPAHNNSEFPASTNSSPNTFASSAPPSVLLATPPFGYQLPQLQHQPPYNFYQQPYTFPNGGDQYYANPEGYVVNDSYAPQAVSKPLDEDQLGLTTLDENYQFPPPSQFDSRTKSPERTPRGPPLSPSHGSDGSTPVQEVEAPSPHPASAPRSAPPLVSPSPITPIHISMHQQQAEYAHQHHEQVSYHHHQHPQGLDNLGVDVNLSVPEGGQMMDPQSFAGLLDFSFPGSQHHDGQVSPHGTTPYYSDAYQYAGSGGAVIEGSVAGNVLLGDVALGVHDDQHHNQHAYHYQQQQPYATPASGVGAPQESVMGPLDIPLHELYGTDGGASFDPASYIDEGVVVVDGLNLSSAEALEYDMMEWRRNSGSNNGASPAAPAPTSTAGAYASRRASVQLTTTFGGDMAMALYGFDGVSSRGHGHVDESHGHHASSAAYGMNVNMGMEFDFQPGPPPTAAAANQSYGPGYAPYAQPSHLSLGTVAEERERASSEEAA